MGTYTDYHILFYTVLAQLPEPKKMAPSYVQGADGATNPYYAKCDVGSSWNITNLTVATPQSLSDLKINAAGQIYFHYTDHVEGRSIDYYLGTAGLTDDPAQAQVSLKAASITATISPTEREYDGDIHNINITVTHNGTELVERTDYTVAYSPNPADGMRAVGTYTITITGIGNYYDTITLTHEITPINLSGTYAAVTTTNFNCYYTGSEITPAFEMKGTGHWVVLTEGTDYMLSYSGDRVNPGTFTLTATGIGNYGGSVSKTYTILPLDVSTATVEVTMAETALDYTGSAQEPAVTTVKVNGKTLTAGTDYDVSYDHNIDPTTVAEAILTFKGNYTGTYTQHFTINKIDISDATITSNPVIVDYNGAAQNPVLTITKDGTLVECTDYTVAWKYIAPEASYPGVDHSGDFINAGNYYPVVTAIGDRYTGSNSTYTYTISQLSGSNATVTIDPITYNGTAQTPEPTVTYGGVTLVKGTDYNSTFAYLDNTNAGTAHINVTFKGNYMGAKDGTFDIMPKSLSGGTGTFSSDSVTFNGSAQKPTLSNVKDGSTALTLDTDYTVAWKLDGVDYDPAATGAFTNIGTYTATITGTGNYTDSFTKDYVINPLDASTATITIADQTYTGSALTPAATIVVGGNTLTAGTDYEIAYSSNTNVGTGVAKVTFKGNYTGTKDQNFTIAAKNVSSITVTSNPASASYSGNANTPALTVTDGGTTMTAGTDYTVTWTYNGNPYTPGTFTEVGTYTATITGTGNYTGTTTKDYVVSTKSGASATITTNDVVYNGAAQEPLPVITLDGRTLVKDTDYTITSYANNTNVGTATINITFKGNYTGTKAGTFKITKTLQTFVLTPDSTSLPVGSAGSTIVISGMVHGTVTYTSSDTSVVTVTSGGVYTVSTNTVGTATITVKAAGDSDYEERTQTFTVNVTYPDNCVYIDNRVYPSLSAAITAAADGQTIKVRGTVAVDATAALTGSGKDIVITGETASAKLVRGTSPAFTDSLITVGTGTTLNITNLTIDGGDTSSTASMIDVTGSLTLGTGATITGGNTTDGGAIMVKSGATFTLNGGTLDGNNATDQGGAVYVANGGNITVTSGTISNNTAVDGAAIYIEGSGTHNITGGTLSNNKATDQGGGVYVANNGTLNVSGGTFNGNSAVEGGAIYVEDTASVAVSGGTFTSNKATDGGALYIEKNGTGSYAVSGGTFTSNTATDQGGAIYVGTDTTLTVTGGSISSNTAAQGKGIYLDGATLSLDGTNVTSGITDDITIGGDANIVITTGLTHQVNVGFETPATQATDKEPYTNYVTSAAVTGEALAANVQVSTAGYHFVVNPDGTASLILQTAPSSGGTTYLEEFEKETKISKNITTNEINSLLTPTEAADPAYQALIEKAKAAIADETRDRSETIEEFKARLEKLYVEAVKETLEAQRYIDPKTSVTVDFDDVDAKDLAELTQIQNEYDSLDETTKNGLNAVAQEEGYSSFEELVDDRHNKAEFEATKAAALEDLETILREHDTEYVKGVYTSAIEKITNADYEAFTSDEGRKAYLESLVEDVSGCHDSVGNARKVEQAETTFEEALKARVDSGEFSEAQVAQLKEIITKAETSIDNLDLYEGAKTEEQLQAIYKAALEELQDVKIETLHTKGTKEEGAKPNQVAGSVSIASGFEFGIKLVIQDNGASTELATKISNAISGEAYKAATGTSFTEAEIVAAVNEKVIKTTFNISLQRDADIVVIKPLSDLQPGVYLVNVDLSGFKGSHNSYQVVSFDENGEMIVYKNTIDGDTLTFEASALGDYYLIANNSLDLTWLIILLAIILGLELLVVVYVYRKIKSYKDAGKSKKKPTAKTAKAYSVAFPVLFALILIPDNAIIYIVVLGVAIIAVGFWINHLVRFYNNLGNEPVKTKK